MENFNEILITILKSSGFDVEIMYNGIIKAKPIESSTIVTIYASRISFFNGHYSYGSKGVLTINQNYQRILDIINELIHGLNNKRTTKLRVFKILLDNIVENEKMFNSTKLPLSLDKWFNCSEVTLPLIGKCTIGLDINTTGYKDFSTTANNLVMWDGRKLMDKPLTYNDIERLGFKQLDSMPSLNLKTFTAKHHSFVISLDTRTDVVKLNLPHKIQIENPTLGVFIKNIKASIKNINQDNIIEKTYSNIDLQVNIAENFPNEQGDVVMLNRGCLKDVCKKAPIELIEVEMFFVPIQYYRFKSMIIFIDNNGDTKILKSRYGKTGNVQ